MLKIRTNQSNCVLQMKLNCFRMRILSHNSLKTLSGLLAPIKALVSPGLQMKSLQSEDLHKWEWVAINYSVERREGGGIPVCI